MPPVVSVIIPARNRPEMLKEAVASVVEQTCADPIEVVLVLTGADGATTEAARALQGRHGDVIRIIETPPRNLAASRNTGIAAASGAWVTFLDDDDYFARQKIEKQLEVARATGASVVTNSWLRFRDGEPLPEWTPHPDKHLPPGLSYAEALMTGNFVSNGLLVRTSIMQELGGFDVRLGACEDWDMWRRISLHHDLVYIDEPLVFIRVHGANMSRSWMRMARLNLRHLVKLHLDTPQHLRYMLPRARSAVLQMVFPWRHFAGLVYLKLNGLSGGRIRRAVRRIRPSQSSSLAE